MLIGRRVFGDAVAAVFPTFYFVLASVLRPSLLSGLWGWALATRDNNASWLTAGLLLAIRLQFGTGRSGVEG
jgi:hypothetical protein